MTFYLSSNFPSLSCSFTPLPQSAKRYGKSQMSWVGWRKEKKWRGVCKRSLSSFLSLSYTLKFSTQSKSGLLLLYKPNLGYINLRLTQPTFGSVLAEIHFCLTPSYACLVYHFNECACASQEKGRKEEARTGGEGRERKERVRNKDRSLLISSKGWEPRERYLIHSC